MSSSDTTTPSATSGEVCVDCAPSTQPDLTPSAPSAPATAGEVGKENLLDPSTFIPPISPSLDLPAPLIVIEYCQRCKFGLRANWVQQELLSTFAPPSSAEIKSIMLIPKADEASAGKFRIYLLTPPTPQAQQELVLIWDRKTQSGFPEMRILKQRIRDRINPDVSLGHSDKP